MPPPATLWRRWLAPALCLAISTAATAGDTADDARQQYVLLDNGNVLRGGIEDRGPVIAIIDGDDEIRLSSARVRCWAPTLDALYQYRVDHRFDASAAALESDIEWCIRHALYSRAAQELIALKSRHPQYPRNELLEKRLRSVAEQRSRNGPTRKEPDAAAKERAIAESGAEEETKGSDASAGDAPELARITPENVQQFTSAIQPILSNRCAAAACHGGPRAVEPQMIRLQPNLHASGSERRQALVKLLGAIHPSDPHASKLLVYSTRAHGNADAPPLGAADDDLAAILQQWIVAVATDLKTDAPADAQLPNASVATTADVAEAPDRPQRLPSIADPFDPSVFNNYYQPRNRPPSARVGSDQE